MAYANILYEKQTRFKYGFSTVDHGYTLIIMGRNLSIIICQFISFIVLSSVFDRKQLWHEEHDTENCRDTEELMTVLLKLTSMLDLSGELYKFLILGQSPEQLGQTFWVWAPGFSVLKDSQGISMHSRGWRTTAIWEEREVNSPFMYELQLGRNNILVRCNLLFYSEKLEIGLKSALCWQS